MHPRSENGFTLIELILVVLIIGALLGFATYVGLRSANITTDFHETLTALSMTQVSAWSTREAQIRSTMLAFPGVSPTAAIIGTSLNKGTPSETPPEKWTVTPTVTLLFRPTLPLAPTATVIVLLPSNTPLPGCSGYNTYALCIFNGCYWWYSTNSCESSPEPKPSCSSYSDATSCGKNGCFWWDSNNSCQNSPEPPPTNPPPACSGYTDETSCTKAGCSWDPKGQSCQ